MRKITTLRVHHIFWSKIFATRNEDNVKPPPPTFNLWFCLKLDISFSQGALLNEFPVFSSLRVSIAVIIIMIIIIIIIIIGHLQNDVI